MVNVITMVNVLVRVVVLDCVVFVLILLSSNVMDLPVFLLILHLFNITTIKFILLLKILSYFTLSYSNNHEISAHGSFSTLSALTSTPEPLK